MGPYPPGFHFLCRPNVHFVCLYMGRRRPSHILFRVQTLVTFYAPGYAGSSASGSTCPTDTSQESPPVEEVKCHGSRKELQATGSSQPHARVSPAPMVPNPSLLPAPTLSPPLKAFLCKPQAYTQPVPLLLLLV